MMMDFDLDWEKRPSAAFAVLFHQTLAWVKGENRKFAIHVFLIQSDCFRRLLDRLSNYDLTDVGNFVYNRSVFLVGRGHIDIEYETDTEDMYQENEHKLGKAVYRGLAEKYPEFGMYAAKYEVPVRMIHINHFQKFRGDIRTLSMSRMVG